MQTNDIYGVTIFGNRRLSLGSTVKESMEVFAATYGIFPGDFRYRWKLGQLQQEEGDKSLLRHAGVSDYLYLFPNRNTTWYVGQVPIDNERRNGNWHDREEWRGLYFFVSPEHHSMTNKTEYQLVHNMFNLRSVFHGETRAPQNKTASELAKELNEYYFNGFHLDQMLTTIMPFSEVSNHQWMEIAAQFEYAAHNPYEKRLATV